MKEENRSDKQILIIGGGPAGLTAAYELLKSGVRSIIFEQDQVVGGLSRTINFKNYYFDLGGHRFFTKVKAVENMWREVLGEAFLLRDRLSRIYYNKKFFYYPLRPMNALLGLGVWNSFLIVTSYLYAQLFPSREEETLEQWVSNRFGQRLFKIFFKTYTEKVWGMSCSEIRGEWAAQRIKGLSLVTALKNALVGNGNGNRKNVVKTLIDQFDYPKFGPGMMWQEVADIVRKMGSQVWLGARIEGIRWSGDRIEALEVNRNGQIETVTGTHVISSMPIRDAIEKFQPEVPKEVLEAAKDLKYRDFLTVALIIHKDHLFPDNWIYIHDPDVKVGRIQNYKNWSPYMVPDSNHTCLGLEYFCFEGDDLWTMPDDELIELGKRELNALGLVNQKDVEDGKVVRMPKTYPVYDSTYGKSLEVIRRFLGGIKNLQLVGRNGMHRYNNQDHSMFTAMLAAENILGANHDLWEVNVEQEYHEEIREEVSVEKLLRRAFSKMDKLSFATAVGTVSGLAIFLATVFLVLKGGKVVGPNLALLGQYFLGYTVTLKGAWIGFTYSFLWGFLFGWLFAYLRNLSLAYIIYRARRKAQALTFKYFIDNF
jgi:protoporphyrinogen oxidase